MRFNSDAEASTRQGDLFKERHAACDRRLLAREPRRRPERRQLAAACQPDWVCYDGVQIFRDDIAFIDLCDGSNVGQVQGD